jgi:DNA-binding LytR/AlgR family response regulator
LYAQQVDFNQLKANILEANSEKAKIEGIINYGILISRYRADSLQFYSDSLSYFDGAESELSGAGQVFFKGVQYYSEQKLDSAVVQFEIAEASLAKLNVPNLWFRCRNFLGLAYTRLNEEEQAAQIFLESLRLIDEGNYEAEHARAAHANIVNIYRRLRDYASAIYHSEQLIALSDEQVMDKSLAYTYLNMGQMLSQLEYYERAINSFDMVDLSIMSGSFPMVVLKSKAKAYYELGNYEAALSEYKKANSYAGEDVNPDIQLGTWVLMSEIYLKLDSLEEAKESFIQAESLISQRTQDAAILQLDLAKMDYLQRTDQIDQAINVGLELESLLNSRGNLYQSQDLFVKLSNLYRQQGNNEKALEYSQLYNDLRISMRDSEYANRIDQARLKLAKLESQQKINEAEESALFYKNISNQQLALTLITLIASGLIYRYYRKEKLQRGLKEDEIQELNQQIGELMKHQNSSKKEVNYITLKSHAVIPLENIIYVQSDGPYVEFYLKDKERPEVDRNTLKKLSQELPNNQYIQVHRSYIVNLAYIRSIYSNKLILKNGIELTISRSFKTQVESALQLSA